MIRVLILCATLATARGACVTFEELIAHPDRFECRAPRMGERPDCTACTRRCPAGVEDCVVIASDDACPAVTPTPGTECDATRTAQCVYQPFCGRLYVGMTRETCMFLAHAECEAGEWRVAMVSAPGARHPTCHEVRSAYRTQCCPANEGVFDLAALGG